jgi:hypothetical protein
MSKVRVANANEVAEGRIAPEALLDRLPRMQLAPGQAFDHHPHFFLRGLKRLDLEWRVG